MPVTLTVHDETASGNRINDFTLEFLNEQMTVRELLRARVYQEVADYNQAKSEVFRGLIQPKGSEVTGNGFKFSKARQVEWEEQFERACEAFERNGFFVLVDDRQAESLDEKFLIKADTEVSFVKLMPLVGG